MADPVRIQLRRTKGWRMPENTVKVDRTTKWGNPYPVGELYSQAEAVARHRVALTDGQCVTRSDTAPSPLDVALYCIGVRMEIEQLRGKNLACWCKPGTPCHADVLLELANQPTSSTEGNIDG